MRSTVCLRAFIISDIYVGCIVGETHLVFLLKGLNADLYNISMELPS